MRSAFPSGQRDAPGSIRVAILVASAVPGLVPHRTADRRRLQESLLDLALPAERLQVTRG